MRNLHAAVIIVLACAVAGSAGAQDMRNKTTPGAAGATPGTAGRSAGAATGTAAGVPSQRPGNTTTQGSASAPAPDLPPKVEKKLGKILRPGDKESVQRKLNREKQTASGSSPAASTGTTAGTVQSLSNESAMKRPSTSGIGVTPAEAGGGLPPAPDDSRPPAQIQR